MACIPFLRSFCLEQSRRQRKAALWPMEGTPPCFAVCALVCDPVGEGECVPAFADESKRGRLREKLKSGMKSGWEIKFMVATLQDFLPLLMVMGHREPGNVCI